MYSRASVAASVNVPVAHETWFVPDYERFGLDWAFAGQAATLALLAGAVVIAIVVRVLARFFPGVDIPFLARLAPWMPFAMRMHLAVSLLGLLSLGFYLSPAMDLHANPAGVLLGGVMVVVAFGMVTGWHARAAAALLVLAGPLGITEFGFSAVIQRVDMLGPALFVLRAGPGRWSADHEREAEAEPDEAALARGVFALRIAVGVALIVVAFAEKLANPELALAFLDQQPNFNVAREIGLGMTDLQFVRFAGATEVLFGLLLISGALPQAVVLIAGIPFNATLYFLGDVELMGHLPIYGTMLVLLVIGSDPRLRPSVSSLVPWSAAAPPGPARAVPA